MCFFFALGVYVVCTLLYCYPDIDYKVSNKKTKKSESSHMMSIYFENTQNQCDDEDVYNPTRINLSL